VFILKLDYILSRAILSKVVYVKFSLLVERRRAQAVRRVKQRV